MSKHTQTIRRLVAIFQHCAWKASEMSVDTAVNDSEEFLVLSLGF